MSRPRHLRTVSALSARRRRGAIALAILGLAAAVSGCGLFSNEPRPSPAVSPSHAETSQEARTSAPAPTPRHVGSIVLVAGVGESQAGTPSAVAWLGVQQVALELGAASSMTIPKSVNDLWAAVQTASTTGADVVVTIGAPAAAATRTAALANPSVQFFTLDQAVAADAPENLHAIAFDESEMGYLAGVIAASLSRHESVGLVGDDDSSAATANYADGFRNGALFGNPAAIVNFANAGTATDPVKGRAAAATLVAGAADVVAATSDLSGVGAMREACARGASVVALDTDAWLLVPDVRPCLVTSVRKLYDVAIASAIRGYAAGADVPRQILSDVAAGGVGLTDFRVTEPAALTLRLDQVFREMRAGPPRPTATPSPSASAIPSAISSAS
ncbi:MAG TPA: BMP family ABC transporter substrate-binding protein [Candidatus Limnocylindrales bacterium]